MNQIRYGQIAKYGPQRGDIGNKLGDVEFSKFAHMLDGYGEEVREPDQGLFHRSLKRALSRTRWTNADVAVFDRFCKQVRWYAEARCRPAAEKEKRP